MMLFKATMCLTWSPVADNFRDNMKWFIRESGSNIEQLIQIDFHLQWWAFNNICNDVDPNIMLLYNIRW